MNGIISQGPLPFSRKRPILFNRSSMRLLWPDIM
jgi:hypothetical protein